MLLFFFISMEFSSKVTFLLFVVVLVVRFELSVLDTLATKRFLFSAFFRSGKVFAERKKKKHETLFVVKCNTVMIMNFGLLKARIIQNISKIKLYQSLHCCLREFKNLPIICGSTEKSLCVCLALGYVKFSELT